MCGLATLELGRYLRSCGENLRPRISAGRPSCSLPSEARANRLDASSHCESRDADIPNAVAAWRAGKTRLKLPRHLPIRHRATFAESCASLPRNGAANGARCHWIPGRGRDGIGQPVLLVHGWGFAGAGPGTSRRLPRKKCADTVDDGFKHVVRSPT